MSQQVNVFRQLAFRRGGTGNAKAGPIWTVPVQNTSAIALARGDVVVWDTTNSTKDLICATTTTAANNVGVLGMVTGPIAIGGQGDVQIWGPTDALKADATVAITVGASLGTFTTATRAALSTTAGRFARALSALPSGTGVIAAFITNANLSSYTTE